MNRAVFLDKDGTLIRDVPYNVDPEKITFLPGFTHLKHLYHAGYKLIIVSNQSGVARGFFTEQALENVKKYIQNACREQGFELTDLYYCPHHPDGSVTPYATVCACRKPAPGLFRKAAREHQIDLSSSWMIGDILTDCEAGKRAGCQTILLDTGHETVWEITETRQPDYLVKNLSEAVQIILSQERQKTLSVLHL